MKVLIFKNQNDLKPVGGPAGYVYNLMEGLKEVDQNGFEISYLNFPSHEGKKKVETIKKLPAFFSDVILNTWKDFTYSNLLRQSIPFDFKKYDIVHFHSTIDMYKHRDALQHYTGKVLLNSHCPKAQHREIIEDYISEAHYKSKKKLYDRLSLIDEYAFQRSDNIIFPCEQALEPYLETWSDFKTIYNERNESFKYLLTGIKKVTSRTPSNIIREKYRIPLEAKVVCFVGRHNITKGYDTLIKLHEKLPDVYFLIAGSNEGIVYPKDSHWIEVGWTNDPYSIVSVADLFILPNKQTYFDLVLLEVLSLSKPVLLSETGGNKYFSRYHSPGIILYKTVDEASYQINQFFSLSKEEQIAAGDNNGNIFRANFTCKIFADNYLKLLSSL